MKSLGSKKEKNYANCDSEDVKAEKKYFFYKSVYDICSPEEKKELDISMMLTTAYSINVRDKKFAFTKVTLCVVYPCK